MSLKDIFCRKIEQYSDAWHKQARDMLSQTMWQNRLEDAERLMKRHPRLLRGTGCEILRVSCVNDKIDFLEMFHRYDPKVFSEPLAHGMTLLHLTGGSPSLETLAVIQSYGADIHARDRIGRTPLMAEVTYGRTQSVSNLLDMGSRLDDVDKAGHTALDIALLRDQDRHYTIDGETRKRYPNFDAAICLIERGAAFDPESDLVIKVLADKPEKFIMPFSGFSGQLFGPRPNGAFQDYHRFAALVENKLADYRQRVLQADVVEMHSGINASLSTKRIVFKSKAGVS